MELGKKTGKCYDLKDLRKGYTVNRAGERVYDLPASLVEIFKEDSEDLDQDLASPAQLEEGRPRYRAGSVSRI